LTRASDAVQILICELQARSKKGKETQNGIGKILKLCAVEEKEKGKLAT
jgi:hypothetical protein